MPKVNINAAFEAGKTGDKKRKNAASTATAFMTGGLDSLMLDPTRLDIRSIPIEKIFPREINEFEQKGIETLIESIRLYGLINPLSVVYHAEDDKYIISSGHRRYLALKSLHDEYPDDEAYSFVDCAVYEITTDQFKLKQGLPYISPEQEEGIYRDSNLENRQLSYTDIAHQIRYIIKRFDDPEYIKDIRKHAVKMGFKTRDSDYSKAKLIISIFAQSNYQGWNKETVRQYLKVQEDGREDLLDQIEEGKLSVNAAYKIVVNENKQTRVRRTRKITALKKVFEEVINESNTRYYDEKEIEDLKRIAESIREIIEKNEKENI